MSNKTILILGGGVMQIPAIRAAHRMGWTTVVADGNENAAGREYSEYFEHVDLKDSPGMISAALKYRNTTGLDGVFTAGTDFSETVARVAEAAELPGISVEAALNASNKARMREVFTKKGVSSPRFITVDELSSLDSIDFSSAKIDYPLVVKPVDNMGSRGIRRSDNYEQLREAVRDALVFSRSGNVIIEEFLDGPEFSIDALVFQGKITICGFAERHIHFPPYFVEMGHTIPARKRLVDYEAIIETFKKGVQALGITEGAAKGDIKLGRGRVWVGEIAARLSGGFMSGWTFPYSSGVDLTGGALRIAVGMDPGDLTPLFSKTSAERAFISIPGVVGKVEGIEGAESTGNIEELFCRVSTGDIVCFPENNVEKAGNLIAVSSRRSVAVNAAEEGCRRILIRLEPCNRDTEAFLFGSLQSWVPNAFILKNKSNLETFHSMFNFKSSSNPGIGLLELPFIEKETYREWHGKSMRAALYEVLEQKFGHNGEAPALITFPAIIPSGKKAEKEGEPLKGVTLGRIFWHAFLRGGVQGGLWVIDTVLKKMEEDKNLMELFETWNEY